MSEALRLSQDKRCESWITDEDLCDAVAFVGPERQRVPFLRAPLATLSKPLKVALYGDWVGSNTVWLWINSYYIMITAFGDDEHPFANYFDVYQVTRGIGLWPIAIFLFRVPILIEAHDPKCIQMWIFLEWVQRRSQVSFGKAIHVN